MKNVNRKSDKNIKEFINTEYSENITCILGSRAGVCSRLPIILDSFDNFLINYNITGKIRTREIMGRSFGFMKQKGKCMVERFIKAQEMSYQSALREIKKGRKTGHWMWYIFPQLKGLGRSRTSQYYGIDGLEEAEEYMADPVLRGRLIEISTALLSCQGKSAEEIFGTVDARKLRSSMTLFKRTSPEEKVFAQVLDKYFQGREDGRTLSMLGMA